ncbi:MAG: RtcB family protein, partial [Nitrososphaeraceae archaeon]|nr:RtcB family protein [Nitrososphaeraceae archaeon]
TTSFDIAIGIRELALSLGMQSTNIRKENRMTNFGDCVCYKFALSADAASMLNLWHNKRKNQRRTKYNKNQGLQKSKIGYVELGDNFFAQTILNITQHDAEDVFDLTADNINHSFIAQGIVVHNCWKETYDGEELYVHRKGATPAGKSVFGIIPGSMGDPGYVVKGKGNADSLNSASHGAGRRMSRRQAKDSFRWKEVNKYLEERNVKLISAGLDEVPMAYKNIDEVMANQTDLVDVVARFDPRLVKMAPAGEKPED